MVGITPLYVVINEMYCQSGLIGKWCTQYNMQFFYIIHSYFLYYLILLKKRHFSFKHIEEYCRRSNIWLYNNKGKTNGRKDYKSQNESGAWKIIKNQYKIMI